MLSLRLVFSASSFVGIFFLYCTLFSSFFPKDTSPYVFLQSSIVTTAILVFLIFILFPNIFKKNSASTISISKIYTVSCLTSFICLIPFFALITYLICVAEGHDRWETMASVVALSVLLPTAWFIPIGLISGWVIYQRKCK